MKKEVSKDPQMSPPDLQKVLTTVDREVHLYPIRKRLKKFNFDGRRPSLCRKIIKLCRVLVDGGPKFSKSVDE